jgi:hypothetical protein
MAMILSIFCVLFCCNCFTFINSFTSFPGFGKRILWKNRKDILKFRSSIENKVETNEVITDNIETSQLQEVTHFERETSVENLDQFANMTIPSTIPEPYYRTRKIWGATKSGQEFYRKYPFEHLGLQVLYDVNNYYSGTYKQFFWHQNADQVLIFYPLNDSIAKSDIDCKFDYREIKITVSGEELLTFKPVDPIFPDGSFWTIEFDKHNQRYLTVDLEKKAKFTNWKGLFIDIDQEEYKSLDLRSQVLEQLHVMKNEGRLDERFANCSTVEELLEHEDLIEKVIEEIESKATKLAKAKEEIYQLMGANVTRPPDYIHPIEQREIERGEHDENYHAQQPDIDDELTDEQYADMEKFLDGDLSFLNVTGPVPDLSDDNNTTMDEPIDPALLEPLLPSTFGKEIKTLKDLDEHRKEHNEDSKKEIVADTVTEGADNKDNKEEHFA